MDAEIYPAIHFLGEDRIHQRGVETQCSPTATLLEPPPKRSGSIHYMVPIKAGDDTLQIGLDQSPQLDWILQKIYRSFTPPRFSSRRPLLSRSSKHSGVTRSTKDRGEESILLVEMQLDLLYQTLQYKQDLSTTVGDLCDLRWIAFCDMIDPTYQKLHTSAHIYSTNVMKFHRHILDRSMLMQVLAYGICFYF